MKQLLKSSENFRLAKSIHFFILGTEWYYTSAEVMGVRLQSIMSIHPGSDRKVLWGKPLNLPLQIIDRF
jgi:hypothetical protein